MIDVEKAVRLPRERKIELVKHMSAKATMNFGGFCKYVDHTYRLPPHLKLLTETLDKVERGEIKFFMGFLPPRHGKSETVSRKFPAYYLGKNQDHSVILSSYSATLAESFSKRARDLVDSNLYKSIFTARLASDFKGRSAWGLQGKKGQMISSGVGGSITGYGANLYIIDDPIKNQQEADSKVVQDKIWEWWTSVVLTRLEPDSRLILLMTRWHQKDLAGKIIANAKEEGTLSDWTILNLPAISEKPDDTRSKKGLPLWKERYNRKTLVSTKKKVGNRVWNALYQGKPNNPEDQIISRDWIVRYKELPIETDRYGGMDTATSLKTKADHTALVDVCSDYQGYLYVDDVFCEKVSTFALGQHVSNQHMSKKYNEIFLEANNAGEAIRQIIDKIGMEDKTYPPISPFTTSTDKVVRVNAFAHLIENGTIRFKQGHKKVDELIDHLVAFDGTGKEIDDDVDALGFAINAAMGGNLYVQTANDEFDVFHKR